MKPQSPCPFCTNADDAGTLVFEDARSWVILHPDRSPRGHAMVVSKQHVENASGLGEEEWVHLARVWQRAERVLLDVTRTERAFIMKLGIQTPHLHMHIYPMPATATRQEVFDAFDGLKAETRDETFVAEVRRLLTPPPH